MSLTVCKFGGTSLADGNNIRRAADIVLADPARKYADAGKEKKTRKAHF